MPTRLLKQETTGEEFVSMLTDYAGQQNNLTVDGLTTLAARVDQRLQDSCRTTDVFSMVIPAFPYKSPNVRTKTLGILPDQGEEKAVQRLVEIVDRSEHILNRDCQMVVGFDGFVFNHIDGIPNSTVTAYSEGVREIINHYDRGRGRVVVHGLTEHYNANSITISDEQIADMRGAFLRKYGICPKEADDIIHGNPHVMNRINQLQRYTQGDIERAPDEGTKAFRRRTRQMAKDIWVVSEAWSNLLARNFADSVRLSIHPYTDGSAKFPIQLVPTLDKQWRTPWNGTPIQYDMANMEDVRISTREEAVAKGLNLEHRDNRPWCFKCPVEDFVI